MVFHSLHVVFFVSLTVRALTVHPASPSAPLQHYTRRESMEVTVDVAGQMGLDQSRRPQESMGVSEMSIDAAGKMAVDSADQPTSRRPINGFITSRRSASKHSAPQGPSNYSASLAGKPSGYTLGHGSKRPIAVAPDNDQLVPDVNDTNDVDAAHIPANYSENDVDNSWFDQDELYEMGSVMLYACSIAILVSFAALYKSKVVDQMPALQPIEQYSRGKNFAAGLFSCFSHLHLCLHICFCAPCRVAHNYSVLGLLDFWKGAILSGVCYCLMPCIGGFYFRPQVRTALGLEWDSEMDVCKWLFCSHCAIGQEALEIDAELGVYVKCCCVVEKVDPTGARAALLGSQDEEIESEVWVKEPEAGQASAPQAGQASAPQAGQASAGRGYRAGRKGPQTAAPGDGASDATQLAAAADEVPTASDQGTRVDKASAGGYRSQRKPGAPDASAPSSHEDPSAGVAAGVATAAAQSSESPSKPRSNYRAQRVPGAAPADTANDQTPPDATTSETTVPGMQDPVSEQPRSQYKAQRQPGQGEGQEHSAFQVCPVCNGSGKVSGWVTSSVCTSCNGTGEAAPSAAADDPVDNQVPVQASQPRSAYKANRVAGAGASAGDDVTSSPVATGETAGAALADTQTAAQSSQPRSAYKASRVAGAGASATDDVASSAAPGTNEGGVGAGDPVVAEGASGTAAASQPRSAYKSQRVVSNAASTGEVPSVEPDEATAAPETAGFEKPPQGQKKSQVHYKDQRQSPAPGATSADSTDAVEADPTQAFASAAVSDTSAGGYKAQRVAHAPAPSASSGTPAAPNTSVQEAAQAALESEQPQPEQPRSAYKAERKGQPRDQ